MIFLATILYFLAFCIFSYKYFRFSIGLLFILLPTYLVRLNIGGYPTTLLEITFVAIFLVWLIRHRKEDIQNIKDYILGHKVLFIFISLFFISSIVGIFVSGTYILSFGLWRAYFLEPLILFFILLGSVHSIGKKDLIIFLSFSTLSIIIYSIFQKFTGIGIATPEWTGVESRRVTAFFSSPNAIGLYIAPIFIFFIYLIISKTKNVKDKYIGYLDNQYFWIVISILAIFSLLFTKSQGSWIGLFSGLLILAFLLGYRKFTSAIIVLSLIILLFNPILRSAAFFGDLAGQNRLLLWSQSWSYISASPHNFIFGSGIRQFYDKIQKPNHDWKRIERHIYPHNFFLNFWTEIGLLGMVSVVGIVIYLFYLAVNVSKRDKVLGSVLASVLVVYLVHGLVDVPYFKNDLSFLFWIIVAIFLYCSPKLINITKYEN